MPNSDSFCGRNTFFSGSRHCAAVLFSQVPKKCTDLNLSLLYILTCGTYSKFAWKNNFLHSSFAFRSPARVLAAGLLRQDHVYKTTDESFRLHNKKIDEMRSKLDSTETPRSFQKYPTPPYNLIEGFHFEDGLISRLYFVPNPSNLVGKVFQ